MITKKYYLIILAFISVFNLNCTHINELYKYDLSEKLYYFKYSVNPEISRVNIEINSGYYGSNFPVSVILSEIGGSILGAGVSEKLNNAIQPDSITFIISEGIKNGLTDYYDIIPVESISDEPDFIVETRLKKFSLTSNIYGVYANIDTKVLITSRMNAGTAWESDICSKYPIHDIITGYSSNPWVRTTGSVINAVRLMQMTEEEIKEAINNTVIMVSEEQTERLRQDIYEATQTGK